MAPLQRTLTATADLPTTPAPRLGVLLHEFRGAAGETVKTVSRRCALGPVQIAQLELGRADLTADELADVVGAYAVPRVLFPTGHCEIAVDLAAGTVSVLRSAAEVATLLETLAGDIAGGRVSTSWSSLTITCAR